jgi:hypothetical protein
MGRARAGLISEDVITRWRTRERAAYLSRVGPIHQATQCAGSHCQDLLGTCGPPQSLSVSPSCVPPAIPFAGHLAGSEKFASQSPASRLQGSVVDVEEDSAPPRCLERVSSTGRLRREREQPRNGLLLAFGHTNETCEIRLRRRNVDAATLVRTVDPFFDLQAGDHFHPLSRGRTLLSWGALGNSLR